jgi:16S rRNA (cytosine1402-N4)-methyltransferase
MNHVFKHESVMPRETLEALRPCPGGIYLDMTLGGAGHAAMILQQSAPDGRLFGTDRDEDAIRAAREKLKPFKGRFEVRRCRFAEALQWLEPESCDAVLMDLGISSPQVDWGHRGFSFLKLGKLDMRMGTDEEVTAAEIVNTWSEVELLRIFRLYGEEPRSRRIARGIVENRSMKPFRTTLELADCIEKSVGRRGEKNHPATRVFQALRMQVNDELGQLEAGLLAAWKLLRKGGRLVTISFHSLEARMVKQFASYWALDYDPGDRLDTPALRIQRRPCAQWSPRRATKPSAQEIRCNPRARSAQLRTLVKVQDLPAGRERDWKRSPGREN